MKREREVERRRKRSEKQRKERELASGNHGERACAISAKALRVTKLNQ